MKPFIRMSDEERHEHLRDAHGIIEMPTSDEAALHEQLHADGNMKHQHHLEAEA